MQRVELQQGSDVSRIVYGMWRLGDDTDTSAAHVQAKIEACLAQGITTFDQADIYGDYRSEQILGAALKAAPQLRGQMQIISKCDIALISERFPERRVKHYDTSAAYIKASVEQSLINMETGQLDGLLIHRPDPLMDHRETGAALDLLVQQGKVKWIGVSNFMPWDVTLLQSAMSTRLVTNQIEISLLANASGVLQRLASAQGVGIDAVAVAWLLKHPATILPVLGTNNIDRINALSDAMRVELTRHDWFELYQAARGHEVA